MLCLAVTTVIFFLAQGQAQVYKCPDGWKLYEEGQTCIKIYDYSRKTWDDARAECRVEGADLVKISDVGMRDFVKDNLAGNGRYWIGLKDQNGDGKFAWMNEEHQTPQTAFNWWTCNSPRTPNRKERCVQAHGANNGRWRDRPCSRKRHFICQKAAEDKELEGRTFWCDFEDGENRFCLNKMTELELTTGADISKFGPQLDWNGSPNGYFIYSNSGSQTKGFEIRFDNIAPRSCLKFWYFLLIEYGENEFRFDVASHSLDEGINRTSVVHDSDELANSGGRWLAFYAALRPTELPILEVSGSILGRVVHIAFDNISVWNKSCREFEMEDGARDFG